MADVKLLVPFILKWEGGFVNDPDDSGGATNMGVTLTTYSAYCKRNGRPQPTVDDLKALTKEEWTDIMKGMYWDKWKGDEIKSQSIANILVDWVWCSGIHGIKIPQKLLNVTIDGLVGRNTIQTLNAQPASDFFERIKQARLDFIDDICEKRPANNKFKKGWQNRINAFVFGD